MSNLNINLFSAFSLPECNRYEDKSTCEYFWITPNAWGCFLVPLASLQLTADLRAIRSGDQLGPIKRIIHFTYFFLSICFVVGWALDTHSKYAIESLIGVNLVDLITIGLLATPYLISIDLLCTIIAQASGVIQPKWPQILVGALAFISVVWVIAINTMNYIENRLWLRAYFFYWLASLNAVGIIGLVLLVVYITRSLGLEDLSDGRGVWTVLVFVLFMGTVAVAIQIMDGTRVLKDVNQPFNSPMEEGTATWSKVFIQLQAIGLGVGIWYGWIEVNRNSDPNANNLQERWV